MTGRGVPTEGGGEGRQGKGRRTLVHGVYLGTQRLALTGTDGKRREGRVARRRKSFQRRRRVSTQGDATTRRSQESRHRPMKTIAAGTRTLSKGSPTNLTTRPKGSGCRSKHDCNGRGHAQGEGGGFSREATPLAVAAAAAGRSATAPRNMEVVFFLLSVLFLRTVKRRFLRRQTWPRQPSQPPRRSLPAAATAASGRQLRLIHGADRRRHRPSRVCRGLRR